MTLIQTPVQLNLSRRQSVDMTTLFRLMANKRTRLTWSEQASGRVFRAEQVGRGATIISAMCERTLREMLPQHIVNQHLTIGGKIYNRDNSFIKTSGLHAASALLFDALLHTCYGETLRYVSRKIETGFSGKGEFRTLPVPTDRQLQRLSEFYAPDAGNLLRMHVWFHPEHPVRVRFTHQNTTQSVVPLRSRYYGGVTDSTVVIHMDGGDYTMPVSQYLENEERYQPLLMSRLLREDEHLDALQLIEELCAYSPGEMQPRYVCLPIHPRGVKPYA